MNLCKGLVNSMASPLFSFFTLNYSKVHTSKNENNTEVKVLPEIIIDSCSRFSDCVLDSG